MIVNPLAAAVALSEKQKRVRRYQNSLWLLATEILGFDRLSETFHKPLLDRQDEMRRARRAGKGKFTFWIWPREHYKTTCRKAQVIQDYLCDPTTSVIWWHAVEDKAQEVCVAVSTMLQTNKELRKLFPDGVLPSPNAKRFIGAKEFRLRSNDVNHGASFRAYGAGSEATGGHARQGYLDDPIAANDIADSQIPAKRRWFGATVMNVIEVASGGWLDGTGTRWGTEDLYDEWIKSPDWDVSVRSVYETDGALDYKGESILYPKKNIELKRRNMSSAEFAFQMMNDPSPSGEKPWDASQCEHRIAASEVAGPGFIVVLSDPAPAKIGSFAEDKRRDNDEKDYWANAVVKMRKNGQRSEIILLDGSFSKEWGVEEGFREVCRLQRKWNTPHLAIEKVGQAVAFYTEHHRRIARAEGVRHNSIDLTMTYKGKNVQFAALCDRAKQDEFLLCDTIPPEFLEMFLAQAREWRPLPTGRNTLKYDDVANVVSFAADPVFTSYAPQVAANQDWQWSPFRKPEEDRGTGTRYVRW